MFKTPHEFNAPQAHIPLFGDLPEAGQANSTEEFYAVAAYRELLPDGLISDEV